MEVLKSWIYSNQVFFRKTRERVKAPEDRNRFSLLSVTSHKFGGNRPEDEEKKNAMAMKSFSNIMFTEKHFRNLKKQRRAKLNVSQAQKKSPELVNPLQFLSHPVSPIPQRSRVEGNKDAI